ncbi:MAG: Crp/Fnr family transcriptional regulator [Planctomycetes bacterium]|nr:Crp/Fnr family transcriptional regulator [Planctomycetota bacterium]
MIDATPTRAATPTGCLGCPGREISEWCALARDDVPTLEQGRSERVYRPGEVIFHQGSPCFGVHCVASGTVALRRVDAEGRSVITRLVHPHEALGVRTFFAGGTYSSTAEALTEARVCLIERPAVKALLARSPDLALRFLRRLAQDLRQADDEKLEQATLPVRARLARLLLSLLERYGREAGGGFALDLPLARQDMAALLGVRPESVARAVRALVDDGVARFDGRAVVVPSVDRLLEELPPGA